MNLESWQSRDTINPSLAHLQTTDIIILCVISRLSGRTFKLMLTRLSTSLIGQTAVGKSTVKSFSS